LLHSSAGLSDVSDEEEDDAAQADGDEEASGEEDEAANSADQGVNYFDDDSKGTNLLIIPCPSRG
jgi:hypothetical protein